MKKIVMLGIAVGMLLAGLVSAQAHEGQYPHAERNWSPRPDCFKYHQVNGPVQGGDWHFNDVVAEIRNKVPALRPMRGLGQHCPPGANTAHINVDWVQRFGDWCWFYDGNPGPERAKMTFASRPACADRRREWSCEAVSFSVGMHAYRQTGPGVRKGCRWTGSGPDHLAPVEARKLQNIWN